MADERHVEERDARAAVAAVEFAKAEEWLMARRLVEAYQDWILAGRPVVSRSPAT